MELEVSFPPEQAGGLAAGSRISHDLRFHHFAVLLTDEGKPWILGEGSFGTTYKATDTRLQRLVALKVLKADLLAGANAKERFEHEARVAASFQHPSVASVYYFGEQDGACFYAMEFVEGDDIEQHVGKHGPLVAQDALSVAAQIAAALGAGHDEGLVHRDVKPANIILGKSRSGKLTARLIDFGLLVPGSSTIGRSERFEGTPLYASPEQFDGGTLDARSDVYSLGATLFFMLTGRAPFVGTFAEVETQHSLQTLPVEMLDQVAPGVGALVAQMMQKDPAARPQSGLAALPMIETALRSLRGSSAKTGLDWLASEYASIEREASLGCGAVYRVARKRGEEEHVALHLDTSPEGLSLALRLRDLQAGLDAVSSACFRRILRIAETSDGAVVVLEAGRGTRLLSVLRVRRVLPVNEALRILEPLAAAIDEASIAGISLPRIGLRDILLQPTCDPSTPLAEWKYLRPKIDLIGLEEAGASDVNATIANLGERSLSVLSRNEWTESPDLVLASLLYELVGGRTVPQAGHYFPLAELSEAANALLRETFRSQTPGRSAQQLLQEIFPKTKLPVATVATKAKPPVLPRKEVQRESTAPLDLGGPSNFMPQASHASAVVENASSAAAPVTAHNYPASGSLPKDKLSKALRFVFDFAAFAMPALLGVVAFATVAAFGEYSLRGISGDGSGAPAPPAISFAQPVWLWLLVITPFMLVVFRRQLGKGRSGATNLLAKAALICCAVCLVLALSRPQLGRTIISPVQAGSVDIMLAVDVSPSMLAEDFSIGARRSNRLEAVKQVMEQFIRNRPNDRIGIVAFAGSPYLVGPLTLDHDWLLKNLGLVRVGLVEDGTAIGSGLAAASNRLKNSEAKSKIVLLLTDGENNSGRVTPSTAAEAAKALGIKVYTIGAGSRGPVPYPVTDAGRIISYRQVHAEFDEQTLEQIAAMTGASYYRATDTKSLEHIFAEINQLEKAQAVKHKVVQYQNVFPWFVLAGTGLLMTAGFFRSRSAR